MPKKQTYFLISFILLSGWLIAFQVKEEEFSFRFAPKAGTFLAYSLSSTIRIDGMTFLGKDLSLIGTARGEIQVKLGQSVAEQVYTAITSPGINVTIQALDSSDNYLLRTKEGKSLQVVFSQTGRVNEIINLEALEEKEIMNFSISQILRDYFPTLPEKPVKIGDSWLDHKRLLIPFQGMKLEVLLEIKYTLNSVFRTQAGQSANVSVDYNLAVSGKRGLEEMIGLVEGKGVGYGMLNFLIDKGYFTEYRLNYGIDASLFVKKADKVLMEWPLNLKFYTVLYLMNYD